MSDEGSGAKSGECESAAVGSPALRECSDVDVETDGDDDNDRVTASTDACPPAPTPRLPRAAGDAMGDSTCLAALCCSVGILDALGDM